MYQVSLMTARHALVSLEREGIVERHRGVGTSPACQFARNSSGQSLLRIRQIIYAAKSDAIMCVLGYYRSDRHNFVVRRYR